MIQLEDKFIFLYYFASLCIIYLLLLKEEIAAVNLSKYRRAQGELEDAEDRADSSESSLSKLRSRSRGSVSTTRTVKSVSINRMSPSVSTS